MENTDTRDLRAEILTNELGNRMLDMVAPIYDRSKVALHLFQALGNTMSKQTDFFSFQLPTVPNADDLIQDQRTTRSMGGGFNLNMVGSNIIRIIIADNTTGLTIFDDCIDYSKLEAKKKYTVDCGHQFSYTAMNTGEVDILQFSIRITGTADLSISSYKSDRVLSREERYNDNFISQIFIPTATWGIFLWEEEYGITPDPTWTLVQRRQNILATMKYKAPITPKKLADRITAVAGIPTTVKEVKGTNSLEVILSKLTLDYSKISALIDRIAPAHLIYDIHVEEEERITAIGNYYKIMVSEMETMTLDVKYTVLTDDDDILLTDENDNILTV